MVLGFLNLHLEVREWFPLLSGQYKLEINLFYIRYTNIFYPFLFHFYISCPDQPWIKETWTQLAQVLNSWTLRSSWISGILNLHLEVRELFSLPFGHPNLKINIFHISYTIIFHPFVCHFYVSCSNQAGIRETWTRLEQFWPART